MRKRVNFGLTAVLRKMFKKKFQSIHPFVLTLTKTFQNIRTFSPGGPCGPWSPLGPSIPAGPGLPAFPGSPGAPLSPYKLITDEFKKIEKDHMTVSALHARKEDKGQGAYKKSLSLSRVTPDGEMFRPRSWREHCAQYSSLFGFLVQAIGTY